MIFFLQLQPPCQLAATMAVCLILTTFGFEFEDLIFLYLVVALPIFVIICWIDYVMMTPAPACTEIKFGGKTMSTGLKPQATSRKDRSVFNWLRRQNGDSRFAVIGSQDENDFMEALFDNKMSVNPIRHRQARLNAMMGLMEATNAFNVATTQQRNSNWFKRSMRLATVWTNGPSAANHDEQRRSGVFGRFCSKHRLSRREKV